MRLPSELNRIRIFLRPAVVNRYLKKNPDPKLHLGSGNNVVPGWLNSDKFDSRSDIYLNVCAALPFRDNIFPLVYAEHLLEHIPIRRIRHVFSEVFRILKPGGLFRVSVPGLELFAKNYVQGNDEFFRPYKEDYELERKAGKSRAWILRTNGAYFMTLAHFFHHRWMYDFETLEACGRETGFSRILRQEFRKSVSPEAAQMDREKRKPESIYADLIK